MSTNKEQEQVKRVTETLVQIARETHINLNPMHAPLLAKSLVKAGLRFVPELTEDNKQKLAKMKRDMEDSAIPARLFKPPKLTLISDKEMEIIMGRYAYITSVKEKILFKDGFRSGRSAQLDHIKKLIKGE
jgi:hypothetical protein